MQAKSGKYMRSFWWRNLAQVEAVLLFADALAYAKNMSVGMAQVHLAHAPRHISGRTGNVESSSNADLVKRVHVFHPHRHPTTLVVDIVVVFGEGAGVGAAAAAALPVLAEKDLALLGVHGAEAGRRAPVPMLLPAPFLKPNEGGSDVRNVEDGSESLGIHSAEEYHAKFTSAVRLFASGALTSPGTWLRRLP